MLIRVENLSKSYKGLAVIKNLSLTISSGKVYCLMGPSGIGKTTLLRLLLGLEHPDTGSITGVKPYDLAAVFQENRLCEAFSPIDNLLMVTGSKWTVNDVKDELCHLLPEESLIRPVHTLSGGMKRRVALLRALLVPSKGILMDEPFTGLDKESKQAVIRYVLEKARGKLLLISTHQEEDVKLLDGTVIRLS